ncbi:MAG TPA: hypothetical protein DCZ80_04245 [Legionellales bacterium]|nr:hypothetical protein [Legionellales bacterium]
MSGFINVPQARTCRIIKDISPELIEGLYTDNISECNILILLKANKISMTHVDRWTHPSVIQNEMDWIGDVPKIVLLSKEPIEYNIVYQTVLMNLLAAQDVIVLTIPQDQYGLSINYQRQLKYYQRTALPKLIGHPQEYLLHHTYTMNRYFYDLDLGMTTVIFDVDAWRETISDDFSLCAKTQRYYDAIQEELDPRFPLSYSSALGRTEAFFKLQGKDIDQYNKALLAQGFLMVHSGNDYQNIFTDELKYIIQYSIHSQLVPEFQITLLNQILELCKDDLMQLMTEDNIERLSLLQPSAKSSIYGVYKVMYRFFKHSVHAGSEESELIEVKSARNQYS